VASEYAYSNGFFEHTQNFNRFNFFTKYNGKITKQTYLSLSVSTFNSKWNASGQIPDRAVVDGSIGLSINNIFNIKWKETQFDTESRLKNEATSVEEIHFTQGTKFSAKLALSIFF
jgi:hypothetical protein